MADLTILHDAAHEILTVWFVPPPTEFLQEPVGPEVVLLKDRQGHVLGFERHHYVPTSKGAIDLEFRTISGATQDGRRPPP